MIAGALLWLAGLKPWLKSPNFYAIGLLVFLGAGILIATFVVGVRYERRGNASEIADTNVPLAHQRGKDEAELSAEDKTAKAVDEAVRKALSKRFILDAETARLLSSVR